jgi:hypothetical protein
MRGAGTAPQVIGAARPAAGRCVQQFIVCLGVGAYPADMSPNSVRTEIDNLRRKRLALQDEMCFLKDQIMALEAPDRPSDAVCANHAAGVSEQVRAIAARLFVLEARLAELSTELRA